MLPGTGVPGCGESQRVLIGGTRWVQDWGVGGLGAARALSTPGPAMSCAENGRGRDGAACVSVCVCECVCVCVCETFIDHV